MLQAKQMTPGISLNKLLENLIPSSPKWDRHIIGLSSDSRTTQPGDLFIAYLGQLADRPKYIEDAIKRGAVAILREPESNNPDIEMRKTAGRTIPLLTLANLQDHAGAIAARFYNDPSADMQIIGITGTNGKTSCSQFIARAMEMAGNPCGIIGTLGHGFPDHLNPGIYTTPDAIGLQQELAQLKEKGAKAISMEVSSHGLDQNRVGGVKFDIGVFTNLTQDHLDYHGTMENYARAKHRLFEQPGIQYAIINADDAYGRQLLAELPQFLRVYGYSMSGNQAKVPMIMAHDVKLTSQGFSAKIESPWGKGVLQSQLLGRFNLSNLLAVLTVLSILEIPFKDALHYVSTMPTVPGRMQAFGGGKLPLVVVDYSHTPDSLEKALTALRDHCQGKLWCVFGCGGNRDAGKRPLMAQVAERLSDQLIITDDNPRHEDPQRITDDIVKGLLCPWAAEIEHNRQAAIAHAIGCAEAGDVVLIAGKGHETYQQIGADKIPFNDAEQVQIQLGLKPKR